LNRSAWSIWLIIIGIYIEIVEIVNCPENSQKDLLRRRFISHRQALDPSIWRLMSDRLCDHLTNSIQVRNAQTILAYRSHRQEPSLDRLFNQQKQWGLPRTVGQELSWHRWQPSESLVVGKYNIQEPDPTSPLLTPDFVDLILLPAVAIDQRGYRLGYGGGYYDRLRADPCWRKIPTIGIVFDFAAVDELPAEDWDLPIDAVCTELGMRANLLDFVLRSESP
jgi:5-formyltetrahydrofolate cyclo-ligase